MGAKTITPFYSSYTQAIKNCKSVSDSAMYEDLFLCLSDYKTESADLQNVNSTSRFHGCCPVQSILSGMFGSRKRDRGGITYHYLLAKKVQDA